MIAQKKIMNSSDEPTRFDSHQTKLTKKLAGVAILIMKVKLSAVI